MYRNTKFLLFIVPLCVSATLHAQIEVARLLTKGESATGFGTYLHAGFPIGQADEISGEVGLYYFAPGSSHLAFLPLLAGYRHTLNGSGTGWYLEPFAGYSWGGSDIEKTDANGNVLYNSDGSVQDQKISGATAGLGFGYLVPSASVPLNIGLRFEHIFVSGDPAQSLLSLRISWSLLTARRLQQ
jgi:Autotransporter beta-domain